MLKLYTFKDESNTDITVNLYQITCILIPSILDDKHVPLICLGNQFIKVKVTVAEEIRAKWIVLGEIN